MMMNSQKLRVLSGLLVLARIFGSVPALYAQVDAEELEKNQAPVTFINYEGPHSRIETRAQIRNIGYGLGAAVGGGTARPGVSSRYYVIHSVSAPDGDKLDADIFGLGVDTGVDHIRNLRRIIQGYLEGAYGYSERDASLLAEYITIYNAIYRGNWDYFGGRYKNPVIQNLVRERAGLSIRYDEWPGRTMMLIPLGSGRGGPLSTIDTSSLTDGRVTEELRKEEDRGVDQRRDMVDLKEREAEEAEQKATVQREAIREEEQRIAQERADVNNERNEIARERQDNRQDAEKTPEERRRQDQELDRREEAAEQRAEDLDKREDDLARQRQEAGETEEFAERKNAEAQQEREDIAKDQQEIITQEESAARVSGVLGASIETPGTSLGRLVKYNAADWSELRRSPLATINVRTLSFIGDRIVAVAGENRGNGAIRLIEVSGDTLEMIKQGDDDIHPDSLLWINGGNLYAITVSEGQLYLGRFNDQFVKQARSAVTVHSHAAVLFQGNSLLTQRGDGSTAILNPMDLTELK
ncbi:MAG: hypothetical protein LBQ55_08690 [Treponema sp.]|jgi:flagellar biosynthesis GTPase FlhF|nr:hypothetical protein [Treponema sp.]